jgi:hypothetical protein
MGWWTLSATKEDASGNPVELDDCDLEHIAKLIQDGYTSGEVNDLDEDDTHEFGIDETDTEEN